MTNEEAIKWLKDIHHRFNPTGEKLENEGGDVHLQALNMAIEALQAKTDGDTISRRMAIKAVHDDFDECCVWDESGERTADEVESILGRVPSAEPRYMGCTGCVHYDQQQTALLCRNCKRSYRDMYEE